MRKEYKRRILGRFLIFTRERKYTDSGVEHSLHVFRIGYWHWKIVYWKAG